MDQVYRIGRRLGKLMLALLMVVSLFDLTSLFANDETNAPAKVIQLCDEENIQSSEDGELLIPWSSTVETTDENMLLYNDYENTMQENLYATPDTLNLQIVDHTGGKQIELVEGTDYDLYYTNPSDGLFTMNKEDATQFTHFKIMFTDKTKTFSNMIIKYNTHAKIADVKENEQERKFLNEATFKIETNYWITETATYTYTNPNFKPVENSMNAQENVNAIYAPKEFNWEDDIVKIKASVTQRDIPDNVIMKAERVNETADKENNIITEVLDQVTGIKFYYQVTFTSNDEVVAIDQSKIKFESSVKQSVKAKPQYRSARSNNSGKEPDKSVGTYPERYKIWPYNGGCEEKHENSAEGNQYQYGEFGEDTNYDIFNILANYNVFTFDYYYGTHVVGPVVIGGEAARHNDATDSTNLSIGGTTKAPFPVYAHNVPSYFGGNANIGNTVITNSNMPIFMKNIGTNNKVYYIASKSKNGQIQQDDQYNNYYFTDDQYPYINMNEAKSKIEIQARDLSNFEGVDITGHEMKKVDITKSLLTEVENKAKGEKVSDTENRFFFEKSSVGIGLRIKLGYNYVFDEGIIKELSYIVYDYEDLDEASTLTTFLNFPDSGTIDFPAIYKSKSDELGSGEGVNAGDVAPAYQFDSIEVEKGLNIVNILPNATIVNVGFRSLNVNESLAANKLVGHLVAPKAFVDIRSGDYNGTIIANKVSSKAEGHMWPFKLDTSISFKKTVNGEKPMDGEVFEFTLKNIQKPNSAAAIEDQTKTNNINGLVTFELPTLTVAGDYIFEISEINNNINYQENTSKYYAKVSVESSGSTIGGNKLVAVFKGFYEDENCITPHNMEDSNVLYNNIRQMSVQKKWLDENGDELDKSFWKPVDVEIHRIGIEDSCNKVVYNVWTKKHQSGKDYELVTSDSLVVPKNYKDEFTAIAKAPSYNTRCVKVKSTDETIKIDGSQVQNQEIKLSELSNDTVIDIYFDEGYTETGEYTLNLPTINFDVQPSKTDEVVETINLNNENSWMKVLNDNNNYYSTGKRKNASGNLVDFEFSYYVKEINVPEDVIVSYTNNEGIVIGSILITNQLKPKDLVIQKKSCTGNNDYLADAKFRMFKANDLKSVLKFSVIDNSYKINKDGDKSDLSTGDFDEKIGRLSFKSLPADDYVLNEYEAPNGFVIDNEYIYIHIDHDMNKSYYQLMGNETMPTDSMDKVYISPDVTDTSVIHLGFAVENTPNIDVPETGGTPNDRYQKIGFLLACTGLAMYAIYEVKRKKNKEKSTN